MQQTCIYGGTFFNIRYRVDAHQTDVESHVIIHTSHLLRSTFMSHKFIHVGMHTGIQEHV